jgi:hypothetical protein
MESYFGLRRSKISAGIFAMVNALHSLALRYLDNPVIFHGRMAYYAEQIYNKCGLAETTWGSIDGTLTRTCRRPSFFQELLYSGHKRCHGIKFQSVFTPDGLFACMYGPKTGNRHDSFMMSRSQLLQKLRVFMPQDGGIVYSLYGDPAYPQLAYVYGGYRNPPAGSLQAAWNTQMSQVRDVVEWGFANIVSNWSFLDFTAMMVFKSPVAKYFVVAAFLVNLRTSFYGNQTMDYFNCTMMTIDQYLLLRYRLE